MTADQMKELIAGVLQSTSSSSSERRVVSWKQEIKTCKADEPAKIMETLQQLDNMAGLDGMAYTFDATIKGGLPMPKPDVTTLDPVVDYDKLKAIADNKRAMAMLNSGFMMSQHARLIRQSAGEGYDEGRAYLGRQLMQERSIPVKTLAPMVLNKEFTNLKWGATDDPTIYWDDVGELKHKYEMAGILWPEERHLVQIEPLLAADERYANTIYQAKSNKVLASVSGSLATHISQSLAAGLTGSAISVPAPVTMDVVVLTESEIEAQMKYDHCQAHLKNPAKYQLMGKKSQSKTDKKEVSLATTDGEKKAVPYKCGKCGEKGHKSADCPKKSGATSKTGSGNSNGNSNGGGGSSITSDNRGPRIKGNCNRCGKPHHIEAYCQSTKHKDGTVLKPNDKANNKEHANANVEIVLASIEGEEDLPVKSVSFARDPVEYIDDAPAVMIVEERPAEAANAAIVAMEAELFGGDVWDLDPDVHTESDDDSCWSSDARSKHALKLCNYWICYDCLVSTDVRQTGNLVTSVCKLCGMGRNFFVCDDCQIGLESFNANPKSIEVEGVEGQGTVENVEILHERMISQCDLPERVDITRSYVQFDTDASLDQVVNREDTMDVEGSDDSLYKGLPGLPESPELARRNSSSSELSASTSSVPPLVRRTYSSSSSDSSDSESVMSLVSGVTVDGDDQSVILQSIRDNPDFGEIDERMEEVVRIESRPHNMQVNPMDPWMMGMHATMMEIVRFAREEDPIQAGTRMFHVTNGQIMEVGAFTMDTNSEVSESVDEEVAAWNAQSRAGLVNEDIAFERELREDMEHMRLTMMYRRDVPGFDRWWERTDVDPASESDEDYYTTDLPRIVLRYVDDTSVDSDADEEGYNDDDRVRDME